MKNGSRHEPKDDTKGPQNGSRGGTWAPRGCQKGSQQGAWVRARRHRSSKDPPRSPRNPPGRSETRFLQFFLHFLPMPLAFFLPSFHEALLDLSSVLAALGTVSCRVLDVCPGSSRRQPRQRRRRRPRRRRRRRRQLRK